MVELEFCKEKSINFQLIPYTQTVNQKPYIQITKEQKEFNKQIEELNDKIKSDSKLKEEFNKLAKRRTKAYESYLLPNLPLFKSLYYRGYMSGISKSQSRLLLNLIRCESHRDILLKILENKDI